MSKEKLFLYSIDLKYNRDLAKHDDNVLSQSPQIGKENRPYIGVLVMVNNKEYCVPISSPKPKHSKMKMNFDCLGIYDREKLLSVLNFNNMIPVCKTVIQKIDITVRKNDSAATKNKKYLLAKELDWCQQNSDSIVKNAKKTYNAVTGGKEVHNKLIKRSCDFTKLEQVLDKWIEKEIRKSIEILNANPELKSLLNKATIRYCKENNLPITDLSASPKERLERREIVLSQNPKLKTDYDKAMQEFNSMQKTTQQPQTTPKKPKHKR